MPANSGLRQITLKDLQTSPNKLNEELQYIHDVLTTTHSVATSVQQQVTKLQVAFQTSQVPAPGSGSPAGPGSNVTIVSASWINLADDGSGQPKVQITVVYQPPNPLNDFQGVEAFVDHPDSSGLNLLIADGTVAADGTHPASNGDAFSTDDMGFFGYDPKNKLSTTQIQFNLPAPKQDEQWRIYLVTATSTNPGKPVKHLLPNESPNYQISVVSIFNGGGPNAGSGREFAPLVQNWALTTPPATWLDNLGNPANPYIEVQDSGDQYFRFQIQFDWPTGDQNFSTLGGVDLELDDGFTKELVSSPSPGQNETTKTYTSDRIPVKPGITSYNLYIVSYDVNGNRNTLIHGTTPWIPFTIQRQTGPAGQEYCKYVVGATQDPAGATPGDFLYIVQETGADGTALLRIIMNWTKPANDSQWGSADLVVLKPDGNSYTVGRSTLPPTENYISNPATVQSWTFYVRSVDINGKSNSIVAGTPHQTINVGTTSGLLNLGKANSSNFSSEFQIVGSVFKIGNLKADTINTGILQVGGGGGRVSQMKVFDGVGALVGFWGDDTLGTGYIGLWAKQARIGGTNPSNAPFQADSSGNTSWSFVSGVTTTVNIDATNIVKVSDTATSRFTRMTASVFRLEKTTDSFTYSQILGWGFGAASGSAAGTFNNGQIDLLSGNGAGAFLRMCDSGGNSQLEFDAGAATSTTATAGAQTLPANPQGFLILKIAGTLRKVPYYAT